MNAFITSVVAAILNWVYGKLFVAVSGWLAQKKADEMIEKKNKEVKEQNEKAQTQEERDAAAEKIINNH